MMLILDSDGNKVGMATGQIVTKMVINSFVASYSCHIGSEGCKFDNED